jgi:threonine/homoserine/homoserine lactone efflux protein
MPLDVFLALASFAFVMAFTPGPNNIMLTASGANFGFVRSIPHMAGVVVGFVILLVVSGGGLGALLVSFPSIQMALKVVGAVYMLWLAWKIANAHGGHDGMNPDARPLTFLQAAAFQWVNPKGVIIAFGAVALYVRPERAFLDLLILLIVFGLATLLSTVTWSCFGAALSRVLRDERRARIFNIVMALLLVASIVPMVL